MKKTLLLATLLFTAIVASAYWSENLITYVYDNKNRGIQGAQVEIKHQQSRFPITPENFDGKAVGTTGADGSFQHSINNYVTREEFVVREYVVFANYMGLSGSQAVTCTNSDKLYCSTSQPKIVFIQLPVDKLTVKTIDQDGEKLTGVTVEVDSLTTTTDSSGKAFFQLPSGEEYEVSAVMEGVKESTSVELSGDHSLEIIIPLYNIVLRIVDQDGKSVEGTVQIMDYKVQTSRGVTRFIKIPVRHATVIVTCTNRSKTVNLTVNQDVDETVTFDFAPPIVKKISVFENDDNLNVEAEVVEEGTNPAGLMLKDPVKLTYSTDELEVEYTMHWLGGNKFAATVPKPKGNQTAELVVKAFDAEGNCGFKKEEYTSGVQEVEEENGGGGFSLDWTCIPIGIIVVVVVFILYKKFVTEEI